MVMPDPAMGSEDFSFVLDRVPGAMVFLGVRPEGTHRGEVASLHSNRFELHEPALATGIALHAAVALARLAPACRTDKGAGGRGSGTGRHRQLRRRGGIDQPHHPVGADVRRRDVVAASDPGQRLALVLAGDRDERRGGPGRCRRR